MAKTSRTQIRGKTWTKKISIDSRQFEVMSKAILASLTTVPIPFTRLVEKVTKRLPDFEGSIPWYAITCARELEVRGQIVRHHKPVRYLKPARPRS